TDCSPRKPKVAKRDLFVQSLMVAKAKEELEQEILVKEEEKQKYLAEKAPPLNTGGFSLAQLQDLCRELHAKIDVVDEERYDIEAMSGMEGRKKMFDAAKGSAQ
uniref:Troponin I type 1a (skeletal, slow) n=1 Tax=Xiphophorus couchianus TaxID=32473 RepID=A0A3B5LGN9_9TELE